GSPSRRAASRRACTSRPLGPLEHGELGVQRPGMRGRSDDSNRMRQIDAEVRDKGARRRVPTNRNDPSRDTRVVIEDGGVGSNRVLAVVGKVEVREALWHTGGLLSGRAGTRNIPSSPGEAQSGSSGPKAPLGTPDHPPQPEYPRCVFSLMNAIRDSREMYFRLPIFVCSISPRFVSS